MCTLLRFIPYVEYVSCCQRALIGIIHTMTSGTQQSCNVTDLFASPFSMKEFHGKGCVAKPRKQRRATHSKNKRLSDKTRFSPTKSTCSTSAAITPLDKASPVISRRSHGKGKRSKSSRSYKSPCEEDSNSTTSSISPIFGLTSCRFMMHKEVKQAWEDRNSKALSRTPLSFKGKTTRSIISMDFRTGVGVEQPFARSYRRYLHSRPTSVEEIGKELGRGQYKHVIVMSGAGISTPSGIPDFRTPGTGLYDNLQQYNLTSATDIFDITFFPHNPKPFFTLAKELYPGKYQPNIVHWFIRLLEQKGVLLRNYTQNIDGLERMAGVKTSKLVEAHGTFFTASCIRCKSKQDPKLVKEKIFSDEIPKCSNTYCKGLVKPDIVFFGEDLPSRFHTLQSKDFSLCDLLIVMGTSLEVEPFASLASLPRSGIPRLLLNRELVGPFKSRRRKQEDFALTGDLVTSVKEISQLAGWLDELEKISACSSSSSNDDGPSCSHGHRTSSNTGGDSSSRGDSSSCGVKLQTSDKENSSILEYSHSPDLSCRPIIHPHAYTSPLKEPHLMLTKLKDSPELQRSLKKLNKQTEAGPKTEQQKSNRNLFTQRLDGTIDNRKEQTSDNDDGDVILCASISNMSIT